MSAAENINTEVSSESDKSIIGFEKLSDLTGFPVEFIKKELLLDNASISVEELRLKVVDYLKRTNLSLQS